MWLAFIIHAFGLTMFWEWSWWKGDMKTMPLSVEVVESRLERFIEW